MVLRIMGKEGEKLGERETVGEDEQGLRRRSGAPEHASWGCSARLGRAAQAAQGRGGATLGQARCQGRKGAGPRSSVGRPGQARAEGGQRARLSGGGGATWSLG
jgi:hypothetical protein